MKQNKWVFIIFSLFIFSVMRAESAETGAASAASVPRKEAMPSLKGQEVSQGSQFAPSGMEGSGPNCFPGQRIELTPKLTEYVKRLQDVQRQIQDIMAQFWEKTLTVDQAAEKLVPLVKKQQEIQTNPEYLVQQMLSGPNVLQRQFSPQGGGFRPGGAGPLMPMSGLGNSKPETSASETIRK